MALSIMTHYIMNPEKGFNPSEYDALTSEPERNTEKTGKTLFEKLRGRSRDVANILTLITSLTAAESALAQRPPDVIDAKPLGIELTQSDREPREIIDRGDFHFAKNHNWALYSWGRDALEEKIPMSGNTIVHVDTHLDMGYDGFPHVSTKLMDSWNDSGTGKGEKLQLLQLENRDTRISNFILDAVALGMSDEIYWVRPKWDQPEEKTTRYRVDTTTYGDITGIQMEKLGPDDRIEQGARIITVHELAAGQVSERIQGASSIIFDVDLDYFSCSGQGAPEWIDPKELGLAYDAADTKDGKVRNPFVTVHRSTPEEIQDGLTEIKNINNNLPDVPISRTAALSPDFLYNDQQEQIESGFFSTQ